MKGDDKDKVKMITQNIIELSGLLLLYWCNNFLKTQCVAEQASLASVHNLDEHSFLQNLLRVTGISYAWLGAYNLQGTWRWIDRTRFSYSNWYSLSSVSSYPCVFIRNNVGWSNTNCVNRYPFFCSTDPSKC
ncbi:ladderlectin-like [Neoarius graeffei]|uniref:ladderlectin-like n=1 Tax=Neoarius graeffei TaxID=443677 RepID=UPI00298C945B|nr:ladderlectin-like [Neoarius graeffei]